MSGNRWKRVSKVRPCPICKKPDWCLIAADESAAICPRIRSHRQIGEAGWLHRLQESTWQPRRRLVRVVRLTGATMPRADMAQLAARYRTTADSGRLYQLA